VLSVGEGNPAVAESERGGARPGRPSVSLRVELAAPPDAIEAIAERAAEPVLARLSPDLDRRLAQAGEITSPRRRGPKSSSSTT
jgi:hypothetical protein